ncbi:MAG: tyrosine--tRNA ligase [Bacteriovoracaceae bacterium]
MTQSGSSEANELTPEQEKEFQRQLKILGFRTSEIVPENEFEKILKTSIRTGTPLRVKCGIDPTNPDVHLGHLVPYRKMRQFQDLGHTGVVIIGDYTASIGDPTGKNESRPSLTAESVKSNAEKYMQQLFTVLDKEKTEVRFQSEWFNGVELRDVIKWASQTTVAKLLSHDTFGNRLKNNLSLSLHELFYPVLQGIDSVYIKADIELGGTDQKFNVLMGRDYQKWEGMRSQVAMLLPIITGTCGQQKMSKSLGNYIGILDEPFNKFGKVMSIPDELMIEYYTYCTGLDEEEIKSISEGLASGKTHPNELKKQLAEMIVGFFHGEDIAKQMRTQFESVFAKGGIPDDTPEYQLGENEKLVDVLLNSKLLPSKGEIRRMAKQNAIKLLSGENEEELKKLTDAEAVCDGTFKGQYLKVGKRKFLKLI